MGSTNTDIWQKERYEVIVYVWVNFISFVFVEHVLYHNLIEMFACPFPSTSQNIFSVVYNQKRINHFYHLGLLFSLPKPQVCPSVATLSAGVESIVNLVFKFHLNLIKMSVCSFPFSFKFIQRPKTFFYCLKPKRITQLYHL